MFYFVGFQGDLPLVYCELTDSGVHEKRPLPGDPLTAGLGNILHCAEQCRVMGSFCFCFGSKSIGVGVFSG